MESIDSRHSSNYVRLSSNFSALLVLSWRLLQNCVKIEFPWFLQEIGYHLEGRKSNVHK